MNTAARSSVVRSVSGRSVITILLVLAAGCGDSGGGGGSYSSGGGSSSSVAAASPVRDRLADRQFHFSSSTSNSDRNAHMTGGNVLTLCAMGQFAWQETTYFSSSVGDMTAQSNHAGSWSVQGSGSYATLVLNIERSDAESPPESPQFAVDVSGGQVRFNGAGVEEYDATEYCAN